MDIQNNPEEIRFVNETIRPLAEKIRSLEYQLQAVRNKWYASMAAKFSTANELIEDGRESEGVSRLTCGDVTNFMGEALKTAPGESGAWNAQVVDKPCVRELVVS